MRVKWLYVLLVLTILALLAIISWLTPVLFDISMSDSRPTPRTPQREIPASPSQPGPVAEVTIPLPPAPQVATAPGRGVASQPPYAPPEIIIPTPPALSTGAVAVAEQPGIGTVLLLRGTASATDRAMRRKTLSQNSRLFLNDTVETGPATRLQIRLDDGSEISQGENSALIFDDYLFDRQRAHESRFAMRIVRGVCRVVTGLITELSPDRFKANTRMSTIGIRGCDVAVKTALDREEIFVIALSGKEKVVRIETTSDGRALRNVQTGQEVLLDASKRKVFDISEPRTMVLIVSGKGPETRDIPGDMLRDLLKETSPFSPARYEIIQKPDGAVLTLPPAEKQGAAQSPPSK